MGSKAGLTAIATALIVNELVMHPNVKYGYEDLSNVLKPYRADVAKKTMIYLMRNISSVLPVESERKGKGRSHKKLIGWKVTMKANTKKLRVEESYRKLCDSVDDVLLLSTIALNNKFGFGEVRIKRFLLEVQRLAKHYSDDYDTSESREIRRIKETRQHHIKVAVKPIIKDFIPDDVLDSFYGAKNDSKSYQKVKNEISKESRISLKEEAELKKSMESMRMLMPKGG